MPYFLYSFIIGQLCIHHPYTACFFLFLLACSMVIKRKPLIFVGLSLCVGVLGAILEFNFINTIQRHTHHLSSVTNKEMIYEVKFLTQPIDIEGELTAFVRTKNDEKLQLKSYSTPKLPLLKPEFYATHSCLIKGKYKPALRSGQLGYLNVQSLHLNQCKPDPPSWSDRIRQLRNTYINHMRTSSIYGKDKLIALATGDIQFIDKKQLLLIRQLGISHLFAVSGTHVAIFIGLLYQLLKRLPIPLCVSKTLLLLLLPCYLIFAGEAPSAQRAVIMASLVLLFSKYIRHKGVTILAVSYIMLTINDQSLHYHLGFQFSFAICFLLLIMQNCYHNKPMFTTLVLTSLISFYGSIPISYQQFNEIQWQSIITNLYFLPLYSIVIIPLAILSIIVLTIFPSTISLMPSFISPIFLLQDYLLDLSQPLTQIRWIIPNYGEIGYVILTMLCFFSLYMIVKKRYLKYSILTITILLLSQLAIIPGKDEMTMIDVGQGDAILFTTRNHQTFLIDTGGQIASHNQKYHYNITEKKLFPILKHKGITHIDYLLITHAHADHMGELNRLSQMIDIRNIVFNPKHFNSDKLHEVLTIARTHNIQLHSAFKLKTLALGQYHFQFIDATVENSQNPNDHSIITFATIHQSTLLLMGDATTENEKRLLQKIKLPKINILKVGHHGSLTSTSQPFLAHIRPQYALISSAKNNVYQLPHPTILKRLQEINCITYNTADTHTLSIQFNPHQPRQYNIYNLTK
ncbi:DNA internalization-related competence protein ComEC/Rec2 [Staphylococcus agnetis]|nr:DNA internalization-related competence protein ComEC/Rec2 [Staphylococcus agnetis]